MCSINVLCLSSSHYLCLGCPELPCGVTKQASLTGPSEVESLPKPEPIPMAFFRGRWRPDITQCPLPIHTNSCLLIKSPRILLHGIATWDDAGEQDTHGLAPRDGMVTEPENTRS
jgi:hypothetical protein